MGALIVSLTGICRSPMFACQYERYLRSINLPDTVASAGCFKGYRDSPVDKAWEILKDETEIDLSGHRTKWIGDMDLREFASIICVDQRVVREVLSLNVREVSEKLLYVKCGQNGLPDPIWKTASHYRHYYNLIGRIVEDLDSFLVRPVLCE